MTNTTTIFILIRWESERRKEFVDLTLMNKLLTRRVLLIEMLTMSFNRYLSMILSLVLMPLKHGVLQKSWIFW